MSNTTDHADAQRTTDAVLRRDRRRIRSLAVLTIALWVLAALLIASVYLPIGAKLKQVARLLDASNPGPSDVLLSDAAKPTPLAQITAA